MKCLLEVYFRKLLFIIVWLVLIFDLYFAYDMFFHPDWMVIFGGYSEFRHVHSWGSSDMIGTFLIIIVSIAIYWLAYRIWFPKMKPINLITFRKSITWIIGFVVLYDIFFIQNMLFYGPWPTGEDKELWGSVPVVLFWAGEILILLTLIVFQIGLGILTYRAWAHKSQDADAPISSTP